MGLGVDALARLDYCDLFVAARFADIKVRPGYHAPRTEVPPEYREAIAELRQALLERLSVVKAPEFSVRIGGVLHRVTAMTTAESETTFVLRRATAGIRPLESLGLPPMIRGMISDRSLRGLVLVVGGQASGKTTTTLSLFAERMRRLGGIGVVIEDPIESDGIEGLHGEGRVHHYSANRHEGGYAEQITKTLRHGADAIMIGEIREAQAAQLVVRESANGSMIFSTLHAGSIPEALARLADFFPGREDGRLILSQSLRLVIYQEIVSDEKGSRLSCKTLSLTGKDGKAVQNKIHEGRFAALEEEIESQRKRSLLSGWPAVSGLDP